MEDQLILNLIERLPKRLKAIEENHGYLSYLIRKRYANEKLLQLEIMNLVSSYDSVLDYLPEKLYDENSTEKCDFWFRTNNYEYWVEIKTRPTNYRKPGHAKAITNSIDSVIEDINRLRNYTVGSSKRYCIFAFYPLYDDSYSTFNRIHLSRISEVLGRKIKGPEIHIPIHDAFFDIYFVSVSRARASPHF